MPMTIQPGQTVRLTCTFLSYDPDTQSEQPIPADEVTVAISRYYEGSYIPVDSGVGQSGSDDSVYYDWAPLENGKFEIVFSADIGTDTQPELVEDRRIFFVGPITTTQSLVTEKVYNFTGELDPMFIEVNDVLSYYPAGEADEIAALIHRHSRDLLKILGVTAMDPEDLPADGAYFVLAAVLCELSRIYAYDGGLTGFTKSDSFTLGDLSVKAASGTGARSSFNGRFGEPTSWCELAVFLRESLRSSRVTIKSYVKAGNHLNPIKPRELRRFE